MTATAGCTSPQPEKGHPFLPVLAPSEPSLAKDQAEAATDAAVLNAADEALKKIDTKELYDEIAVQKAQDAVLEAMKTGDKKKVAELEAKVKQLLAAEKADEATKIKLASEVRKDASALQAATAKVQKDTAVELAKEDKALLVTEEAELEKVVGDDTTSLVKKFFKQ